MRHVKCGPAEDERRNRPIKPSQSAAPPLVLGISPAVRGRRRQSEVEGDLGLRWRRDAEGEKVEFEISEMEMEKSELRRFCALQQIGRAHV